MADNLGTMVLKAVFDGTGITTGLSQARDALSKFGADAKAAGGSVQTAFAEHRNLAVSFAANLRGGNFSGLLDDAKQAAARFQAFRAEIQDKALGSVGGLGLGDVVGVLGRVGTALGGATAGAIALAGGITAIVASAREASRQIENMTRFGERLGVSAQQADALARSLGQAGVEDPNRTLTRFSQNVGDALANPHGPAADTFRRIGVTPTGDLDQDFRNTAVALNGLGSAYRRTSESQNIFGKQFVEIQEFLRRGAAGIARGQQLAELAAPSPETAKAAREAEQAWARLRLQVAGVQAEIKKVQDAAGTRASLFIAETIANALDDLGVTRQGVRESRNGVAIGGERSQGDINAERQLTQLRKTREVAESVQTLARERGLVGTNANRQEAESVADLLQREQQLEEQLRKEGATQQEITQRIAALRTENIAEARRREQVRAAEVFDNLGTELHFATNLRGEAERLGLVRANASQQEVNAVRPLIQARETLARLSLPGAGLLIPAFDAGARALTSRNAANEAAETARQWTETAERTGLTARQVRQLAIAQAEARQAASGWAGFLQTGAIQALRAADAMTTQREQLQQMSQDAERLVEQNRTPLETFRGNLQGLRFNTEISAQTANREAARQFLQLEQSLAPLPSSFAINAASRGSLDEARLLADIQGRSLQRTEDPQERVRAVLEEANRQRQEQTRVMRGIAEAIQNSPLAAAED